MDYKHLRHFVALAEEGRFVAAAARVNLSQAAFSRSIQALEHALGARLFDRSAQGVKLTRVGAAVLERARALNYEFGWLRRDIRLLQEGEVGELVLGAAPMPAATIVPELLVRLRSAHPGLVIRVRYGSIDILLRQLKAETIDFCLADPRLVPVDAALDLTPIGREYGMAYCRPRHPLARKGVIDAADLTRYGVAMIATGPLLTDGIARGLGFAAAAALPLVTECDDVATLARLTAETDVIGLLPIAAPVLALYRLKGLWVKNATASYADVHALWLKGRTLSPAAVRAIALAQAVAADARAVQPSGRGGARSKGTPSRARRTGPGASRTE